MHDATFQLCVHSFDYPDVIRNHFTQLSNHYEFSIALNTCDKIKILILKGYISYIYKHYSFRVPILIKLFKSYPLVPPVVYIINQPQYMILPNHPNVDKSGLVTLKYLENWNKKSNIIDLVNSLVFKFHKKSPLAIISDTNPQKIDLFSDHSTLQSHSISQTKFHSNHKLNLNSIRPIFKNATKYLQFQWHEDNNNIYNIYHGDLERASYHFKILESWLPICELLMDNIIIHKESNLFLRDVSKDTTDKRNELSNILDIHKNIYLELNNKLNTICTIKQAIADNENYSNIFTVTNDKWRLIIKFITMELIADDLINTLFMGLEANLIDANQFVKHSRRVFFEKYVSKIEIEKFLKNEI